MAQCQQGAVESSRRRAGKPRSRKKGLQGLLRGRLAEDLQWGRSQRAQSSASVFGGVEKQNHVPKSLGQYSGDQDWMN